MGLERALELLCTSNDDTQLQLGAKEYFGIEDSDTSGFYIFQTMREFEFFINKARGNEIDAAIRASKDTKQNSNVNAFSINNDGVVVSRAIFKDLIIVDPAISQFNQCVFVKGVRFSEKLGRLDVSGDFSFGKCLLINSLYCENVRFNGKIRFRDVQFECDTNFNNTVFNELVDFYGVKFRKTTIFYKTDFNSTAVFSQVHFHENVLFTYSRFESHVIFRGTLFAKGLDLSVALFGQNFKMYTYGISLSYKNFKAVQLDPKNNCVNSGYNSLFDCYVAVHGLIPHENKIETYRILKSSSFDQLAILDGYHYAARESQSRLRHLTRWYFISDKVTMYPMAYISWYQKLLLVLRMFGNIINLVLNKLSNNYGISWWSGLLFLPVVAITSYSLMNYAIYGSEIYFGEIDWKEVASIFDLTRVPGNKLPDKIKQSSAALYLIIDILSRALLTYGIYQSAAAFRKYRAR